MPNNENTNVQALQEVFQFGSKCYKKGYRRACLELWAGIGMVVVSFICMGAIEKMATRNDD